MQLAFVHRAAMQIRSYFLRSPRRWMALALLALLALPGLAQAACTAPINVPNSFTSPSTNPMAPGTSITITVGTLCDPFGLNAYPGTYPTAHGSFTVPDAAAGIITYTNNGDGATSDSFSLNDASAHPFTVNVAIGSASSPITVSPASLSTPSVGVGYSQLLTASGGTAPYTWSIASGSLPPGMNLSGDTIQGTPTVAGSYSVNIKVQDNAGHSTTKGYTVNLAVPTLTISPGSLPNAVRGVPYNQTLNTSGGTAPYTYSLESGQGNLPAGLSLSSSGVITGTPTATGSSTFLIRTADSSANTGAAPGPYFNAYQYTITVTAPPPLTLSPGSLPDGTAGVAYSQTVSATGGAAPYSYAITTGALPAGISLNTSTGALAGTPTAIGTANFTITATDSNSTGAVTGSQSYALTIVAGTPVISPTSLPAGTVGVGYAQTIGASGGTGPYGFAVTSGSLPAGVSLASNGTLSGTPTAGGTFNFTVTVTDGASKSGSQAYAWTVNTPSIAVAPTSLPAPTVGVSYATSLTASGGTAPYTYAITAGTLPAGMTLNASSGLLSGTPTAAGGFNITVTATDSSTGSGPYTSSRAYSGIVVIPTLALSPAIGTLIANYGQAYSQSFTAGGGTAPYAYALTGSLPAGLSWNAATGTISGTATQAGSFNVAITATDSSTGSGAPFSISSSYTIQVTAPSITLAPAALTGGAVGSAYSAAISASGGVSPYSYAVTAGALPAGISLSASGTVSGTPTAGGSFNATITATDAHGQTGAQAYSVSIAAPTLSLTPGSLPAATAESAYSQAVTAAGGTAPYHYAIAAGSLPAGLTFNASTGALSGTPTVAGSFNFTVAATDSSTGSGPFSVAKPYTLAVNAPGIAISPATLPAMQVAVALSQPLTASGGNGTYSYAITSGALPPGLTLSSSGLLSGTPTTAGNYAFAATATDGLGFTGAQAYTAQVAQPAIPVTSAVAVTTAYNTAASIDLTASITGVDITGVSIGTAPAHGTVSVSGKTVTYTPSSTYYGGTDSFTYAATNPGGTSAPATVTITVGAPAVPVVTAKSVSTAYNTAASIDLTSSITGVDITGVSIGTAPAHGTVSVSGKTVTYTPSSTYYGGSDSFTYTATNPGGTSAPATVTITVGAPAIPTVAAKTVITAYNTAASIDLTASITGVDITGIAIGTSPAHGTVSVSGKTVIYTPSSTYYGGTDSFTYTATNPGGTSAPATVTITVGAPAVPTVAAKAVTTAYNTAASIDLSSSITGVDITGIAIGTSPAHGTVSVSGQTVTYTPSASYYGGSDSFTYTARNPGGTSAPATVTITVTPLNVPTAQALSVATTTGTAVQIQAATGATGPAPFTGVSVAQAPAHGQAVASGEQITYTPAAGFIGTDRFTYQVANHFGSSAAASVTVTVTAAGQASAPDGTVTLTTKPETPVGTDLGRIVAGPFASSTVLGLSPSGAGQVSISQPTALTFTSVAGFHGLAQITVLLTAADGHTATVDVLVLVNSQPDPSKNPDVLGLINAQAMAAQRFAQNQLGNIRQRLESLHDGNNQLFSSALSLSLNGKPLQASPSAAAGLPPGQAAGGPNGVYGTAYPGSGPLARPGIGAAGDGMWLGEAPAQNATDSRAPAQRGPSGLAAWIDGTAAFGSFDAYRQAAGFDADSIAINTGVDQRVGQHGLFGLSLGYNHDRSTIAKDGTRSIAQGYSVAMYGSFAPSATTYVDAVLGGGGLRFDSRRHDSDDGSYLFGHRNGHQWFGSLTAGYEYRHQHWLLSPYGRLDWSYSALNGFAENGDVANALAYGRQAVRTTLAVLGLRASGTIATTHAVLVPRARLEIGHDFQGTSDTTLGYAFVPSAGSWNVLTNPYSANGTSVQAGLGLDIQLPRDLRLTTDYNYLLQPHGHNQMIRFGISKQF